MRDVKKNYTKTEVAELLLALTTFQLTGGYILPGRCLEASGGANYWP